MKPDLRALQELLERASPIPWKCSKFGATYAIYEEKSEKVDDRIAYVYGAFADKEEEALPNANLIVAAVNALPELLKEREMLREVLYRCVKELDYVQSVENCNSGLCATGEGKDCVEEGMKVLDVKDLSLERLKGTL